MIKSFKQVKTEMKYVYQNSLGVQKDFTVGELKKYLNRVPDDYVVCKTLINEEVGYSSIEVLTVMKNQNYIDFKGDEQEGNIITFY